MVKYSDIKKGKKHKTKEEIEVWKKAKINSYIAFYDRAFETKDIDEILEQGGQTSLENFKQVSKKSVRNLDYWNAMFNTGKVKGNLGKEMFERFFKNESVTQNSLGRVVIRAGKSIKFRDKTYKGGQFVPKDYFARRTN